MTEVPFRPARQLSEYKGKGASASREGGAGDYERHSSYNSQPALQRYDIS